MKMTKEEVLCIAELSKLRFTESGLDNMASFLESKLDEIDVIKEIDVTNVKQTIHLLPTVNVLREDVVVPPMDRDVLLSNAPNHDESAMIVPRVVE